MSRIVAPLRLVLANLSFSARHLATSRQIRQISKDEDEEILDVYKEKLKYAALLEEQNETESSESKFGDLNLNRGVYGVFDIEDLVDTIRHQQAEEVFVAVVPKEINYVDYIVNVTGRSQRHMQAIAQFVRRVYKQKRIDGDQLPKLEGANSPDWMALDLGNIALHIFSRKSRRVYDLDSLWAVGPKYDSECLKEDKVAAMLENETFLLNDFIPATSAK